MEVCVCACVCTRVCVCLITNRFTDLWSTGSVRLYILVLTVSGGYLTTYYYIFVKTTPVFLLYKEVLTCFYSNF